MAKTLQAISYWFKALLGGILVLSGFALPSAAQSPGDLAIIGFNSRSGQEIMFVSFADFEGGSQIYFTDRSWNGTDWSKEEGTVTYTIPMDGLAPGEVVILDILNASSSNNGATIVGESFNFEESGDKLYVYTGRNPDSPDTFLYALSTGPDWGEEELAETGLQAPRTRIQLNGVPTLGFGIYAGPRSGSMERMKTLVAASSETWRKGSDKIIFDASPFNFTIPTLHFRAQSLRTDEESGTALIEVELFESAGREVEIEVVFDAEASSAGKEDIGEFTTQTVRFDDSDGDGSTGAIRLPLVDDDSYEGREVAVFRLVNLSSGAIIKPAVLNVEISDNDIPGVVINELHINPRQNEGREDTDIAGTTAGMSSQYIELVNSEPDAVDISGWTLLNDDGIRHQFPSGTVIPAMGSLVLFGGEAAPAAGDGGEAIIQDTGSGTLSLGKTGDNIYLRDSGGNTVDSVHYGNEVKGVQSITRSPDITGSFVAHEHANGSASIPVSPGTKINGIPFGTKNAIAVRGEEGWHMISSPAENTRFATLLGDTRVQGIDGSADPASAPNIFSWDESSGSYVHPSEMSDMMNTGRGYMVYFYEDDDISTSGIQGGFPKILDPGNNEKVTKAQIEVSATDRDNNGVLSGNEGWNLLANPFDVEILVDQVLEVLGNAEAQYEVNSNVQVWDKTAGGGNGAFVNLSAGESIDPYQPFWVRFDSVGLQSTVLFDMKTLVSGREESFYEERSNAELTLTLGNETYSDRYILQLREDAKAGNDRHDAFKRFSLNADAISLYSIAEHDTRLSKNVLPQKMNHAVEIPLGTGMAGQGSYTFTWEGINSLPDTWSITLTDKQRGTKIDLRSVNEYLFTASPPKGDNLWDEETILNNAGTGNDDEARFILAVNPDGSLDDGSQVPESVKLNPNYPNPFNPSTTIPYELTEETRVKLTIWNIVGQKVETLVDGLIEAGQHEVTWNAADMPSGIYIIQLDVGGRNYTRKITLIK